MSSPETPTTEVIYEAEYEFHRLSPFLKVICVCFYSILCFLSVYGNLLVILVILYFKRLRTATNILIINLAIADLFIAIFCMPFSYWHTLIFDDQRWIFGPVMCHLLAFLQSLSVFLSSWSLVVISFDRWMAIMFVLSPTMKLTRKRALYLIAVTWIFSILMALPLSLVSEVYVENVGGVEVRLCGENWKFFGAENEKELIPMVILISVCFAVCWLPLLLLMNVVLDVWPNVATWTYVLYLWWFCHGLAMLHSIVNPCVLFMRNARFREGFRYFSRFLPWIKFTEFKLLAENKRYRSHVVKQLNMVAYLPIVGSVKSDAEMEQETEQERDEKEQRIQQTLQIRRKEFHS
ncbi:hypothetical protein WR25_23561 [Diploscapter pachys]|uniref:G-protein coupled receptors family 1 profile domain-containing protein n=1 Tax=Diploscapter pachys TaxID=2018661 RepID=A0A2A2KKB1_9BILA|nr:hypothetical protein WR25_23561 [Diploscapter pachys]